MIKNLLLACGMTLLPYNSLKPKVADTASNSVFRDTNPRSKTNIYTTNSYDGQTLLASTEKATIEYNSLYFSNLIEVNTRARITTSRDVENEEYYILYELLTEVISNDITNTGNYFEYDLNLPQYTKVDYTSEESYYTYSYRNSLTTDQQNFLYGANYNNYAELSSINLYSGNTGIEEGEITDNTQITTTSTVHTYYYTRITVYYLPQLINDNGASLTDNKNFLNSITYHGSYTVQVDPSQYEVIDLPGLMFEVLGMPFAWLSIAFNFTLFPGTPYAINISHLLLAIVVSLMAIIIFKIIWGKR